MREGEGLPCGCKKFAWEDNFDVSTSISTRGKIYKACKIISNVPKLYRIDVTIAIGHVQSESTIF